MGQAKILAIIPDEAGAEACLDAAIAASTALSDPIIEILHAKAMEPIAAANWQPSLGSVAFSTAGEGVDHGSAKTSALRPDNGAPKPVLVFREVENWETSLAALAEDATLISLARAPDGKVNQGLHVALFTCDRPVLWVPEDWRSRRRAFAHVAIGVARDDAERSALFAAGPWLHEAEQITAIRIGILDLSHEKPAREELHDGIETQWHVVHRRNTLTLGAQIAAEAEAVDADLLVCGAYRHGRFIEWLFGGTTRHLLDATKLPLLLAH